jgi:dTDP-4-amino-4,6-dideoxygalactose transaminase
LVLSGIGPGDEVITPSLNNLADFQAIAATGADIVFCDVDADTLCIDTASAERCLSPATKVIVALDYAGALCDIGAVNALADANGLRVLHDAAHSFGSVTNGRPVGTTSDLATFSFDPVKTITCIDGGAVVVRSEAEFERVRAMRLLGSSQSAADLYRDRRSWSYDVHDIGFRYHLANLHAAIGCAQLDQLDDIVASRRAIFADYLDRLAGSDGLHLPAEPAAGVAPLLFVVTVAADQRAALREHLDGLGVETGIHWRPGHTYARFSDARRDDLSVTDDLGDNMLTLPLHPFMPEEWVTRVCEGVARFFDA